MMRLTALELEVKFALWLTGLRRFLEQMPAPVLQECKADMLRKVQEFKRQDGIHDVRRALIAVGNKRA